MITLLNQDNLSLVRFGRKWFNSDLYTPVFKLTPVGGPSSDML